MAEPLVVNSGPLIALARADALYLLEKLPYDFLCPVEVRTELDAGAAIGHPKVDVPALRVMPLRGEIHAMESVLLDPGEAAVIQLALENKIARVCLDDWKGRRAASAVGLSVTGSLGLLLRAKTLGVVSAISPLIDKAMKDGVWYDAVLLRRVLAAAGEGSESHGT